jgi:PAS domain S-box-containing protein
MLPLLFVSAFVVGSLAWYLIGKREVVAEAQRQLQAIADLKTAQIAFWYKERKAAAEVILQSPMITAPVAQLLAHPAHTQEDENVVRWLQTLQEEYELKKVALYDSAGRLRELRPPGGETPYLNPSNHVQATLAATNVVLNDLHRGAYDTDIHLSFWVPIRSRTDPALPADGALMLQISPYRFLYPLIQTWPVSSPTAEAGMFRREGNEVVFLNELRHRTNTALKLRLTINGNGRMPAVMAALGHTGQVEGLDYRGVPVLAFTKAIPETPWFLGTKVDLDEVLAPHRARAWVAGLFAAVLSLAVALGIKLARRRREMQFLKQQLDAERERLALAQRIQRLFENMIEGYAHCRMIYEAGAPRDFVYLDVNPAFTKLTGMRDVVGKKVSELIPGIRESDPALFETYGRVAAGGQPEQFEMFVAALNHWFSVSVYSPSKDHFVAVFDVITQRKQVEQALKQSERRYRAIGESIDYGVWVCGPDGTNLYASESFLKLVGITQEECSNFGWGNVLHPEDAERTITAWKECVRTGGTWDIEHRFRGVDGKWHAVLARGVPVRDDQGRITSWVGINLDISRIKQAEEEVHRLNQTLEQRVLERTAQLEAANKEMEAFSYSVSHDLRAPLRAVDGFALILATEHAAQLDPEGLRMLQVVRNEGTRMGRLIDDLLAFSRMGRRLMRSTEIDMTALARTVFEESASRVSNRKVRLTMTSLLPTHGDASMIRQVLVNLLSNAIKYSQPREVAEIELGSRLEGNECIYWVKDNGVGFDPRYADKLFGVFQRLHSDAEFEGTGVGLALAQRIIHRHGGRVWAEGKVNEGASFYFTLPNGKQPS